MPHSTISADAGDLLRSEGESSYPLTGSIFPQMPQFLYPIADLPLS
jgi:hypothetical protein